MKLKKSLLKIIFSISFVLVVLVLTEIYLRFSQLGRDPVAIASDQYMQFIHKRINVQWARLTTTDNVNTDHPLEPPLTVFANQDSDRSERLTEIAKLTRNLKDVTLTSYDFLKDRKYKEQTKYTACFNNLGFRSCKETDVKKNKNSIRIIAYGSYQAFGHGVNEPDTYSYKLEHLLNEKFKSKKFEVLNAGRHAGTGIIGLAQFRKDFPVLKPDLIIFDYGFVDVLIADDNIFPTVLLLEKSFGISLARLYSYVINNTSVGYLTWLKLNNRHIDERLREFRIVLKKTIGMALQNNIPVVLIRQKPVRIRSAFYESLLKSYPVGKVSYINGAAIFEQVHDQYKDKKMPEDFWWNEVSPENQALLLQNEYFRSPYLMLDLFQINSDGHTLIANALANTIPQMLKLK
ncbi:hypothetical protein K2P97_07130 [bacterium]|nr:hypothetical protein [bacterium]